MPWTTYPDPDDTVHDYLKSIYTAYRNSLVDPSVLPNIDNIDWDTYWAGLNPSSFMVYEESTTQRNLGLGSQNLEFIATLVIRVTYRWIGAGKPDVIKRFREFATRKLHEAVFNKPSAFTTAGIIELSPMMTSRTAPATNSAQEDFWTFELRVTTKVLNTIV
jgi:hypothetical protein